MVAIAHHREGIDGNDFAYLQNASLHPSLAMFRAFAQLVIKATQPTAAHRTGDAVETGGVVWIRKSFAGLGHGASLHPTGAIWTSTSLRIC